jgi:hypothetical protein
MSPTDLADMVAFRWMDVGGQRPPFDERGGAYGALFTCIKGLQCDVSAGCYEALRAHGGAEGARRRRI